MIRYSMEIYGGRYSTRCMEGGRAPSYSGTSRGGKKESKKESTGDGRLNDRHEERHVIVQELG